MKSYGVPTVQMPLSKYFHTELFVFQHFTGSNCPGFLFPCQLHYRLFTKYKIESMSK